MFDGTTIPVLEQVVQFAQARHGVLAGNLANLDTPGYRTLDLSPERFAEELKSAIAARDSHSTSYFPAPAMMASPLAESGEADEGMRSLLYHDDSDGSLEHQVAAMSKNQVQHNLALTIMTSQFRLLQSAISERVV